MQSLVAVKKGGGRNFGSRSQQSLDRSIMYSCNSVMPFGKYFFNLIENV